METQFPHPQWFNTFLNQDSVQNVLNNTKIISEYWRSVLLNPNINDKVFEIYSSISYQTMINNQKFIDQILDESISAELRIIKLIFPNSLPINLSEPKIQLKFNTLEEYETWFILVRKISPVNVKEKRKPATKYKWTESYVCECAGSYESVQKIRKASETKRCNCSYRISAHASKIDDSITVNWQFVHNTHHILTRPHIKKVKRAYKKTNPDFDTAFEIDNYENTPEQEGGLDKLREVQFSIADANSMVPTGTKIEESMGIVDNLYQNLKSIGGVPLHYRNDIHNLLLQQQFVLRRAIEDRLRENNNVHPR
ncbi:hypothetical protein KGF54_002010 [Candida jiufengensis]|uniref:uncharacterized protein n=1 Tax=Candida jiufengensis TaxID=497108 RepID=UPI0022242535|nr:uncharacterized protein KGF54_002010 [Candida jiufengensis]KAI5954235.1 hypothetical protein KGF54_002010 [Candida jiufengensis]